MILEAAPAGHADLQLEEGPQGVGPGGVHQEAPDGYIPIAADGRGFALVEAELLEAQGGFHGNPLVMSPFLAHGRPQMGHRSGGSPT